MTREVAHFQMFEAALESIQPNFPPGVLQGDPRFSNVYFNMSNGADARGPWNEGNSSQLGETWQYIEDPLQKVFETEGLQNLKPTGTKRTESSVNEQNKKLSKLRSEEIKNAVPKGENQWTTYSNPTPDEKTKKQAKKTNSGTR